MPTLTLVLPRPHPAQRRILAEAKRFNVVPCGRRFGKTTLGINRLIGPALEGYPVAWFSPRFKYLTEVWRDFRRLLLPVTAHKNEQDRRIELITGGVVEFWSLEDPDAGRGRKYRRVVVDEAAMIRNLEDAWNNAIRPTLTDFKGDADLYSTPKGRNFFWKGFVRGQDPFDTEWATWTTGNNTGLPTTSNPYIDPAEVEAARNGLPERVFRQEYLAEFLDDAGGVFRKVSEAVDDGRCFPEDPSPHAAYSLGVDLARVHDFTVLVVLDAKGRQVYHERFNQISWERQINAILEVAKRYKAHVWMDSTGVGDPPFEAVRRSWVGRVSGFQFTNSSKECLIDNLAMKLEQGKIRLMDIPEQTSELLAYQYELTPSRNIRMNAPEGMHDDCVIALALAAWGINTPQSGPSMVGGKRDSVSYKVR